MAQDWLVTKKGLDSKVQTLFYFESWYRLGQPLGQGLLEQTVIDNLFSMVLN